MCGIDMPGNVQDQRPFPVTIDLLSILGAEDLQDITAHTARTERVKRAQSLCIVVTLDAEVIQLNLVQTFSHTIGHRAM